MLRDLAAVLGAAGLRDGSVGRRLVRLRSSISGDRHRIKVATDHSQLHFEKSAAEDGRGVP